MKAALLVVSLCLTGCVSAPVPRDVELMPNDCANRVQIANWLTYQLQQPRAVLQSREDYEHQQVKIKHRLWSLRYNCQPV